MKINLFLIKTAPKGAVRIVILGAAKDLLFRDEADPGPAHVHVLAGMSSS